MAPPDKPQNNDQEAGSQSFASSSLARAADHFAAKDAEPEDKAELWGKRVGRGLSAIGVIVLAFMLGRQLGWW